MKTTKIILIITITSLLAVSLFGCLETNSDEVNSEQPNENLAPSEEVAMQPIEAETYSVFHETRVGEETRIETGMVIGKTVDCEVITEEKRVDAGEIVYEISPVRININDNNDLKSQLVKRIKTSKTLSKDDEYYGTYSANKISDIKKFYNLDNSMIDDYKLLRVEVYDASIHYHYVPIKELDNELVLSLYIDIITIIIQRPENQCFSVDEQLKGFIDAGGILTDNNFIYTEKYSGIFSQIGDTILRISVPDKFNSYEFLSDLYYRVIKTSELIVLEG